MPQLCSFAHQLNFIHSMSPKSAIEIGLGNGFVSSYLRRVGVPITTVDINPSLEDDICASVAEVGAPYGSSHLLRGAGAYAAGGT